MNNPQNEKILSVKNLTVEYFANDAGKLAVNNVSFDINKSEVLALAGESSCGKTTVALSITKLISKNEGVIKKGSVFYKNKNLLEIPNEDLRQIRGKKISYVFQEPSSSLNPVFTIGEQIVELLIYHEKLSKDEAKKRTLKALQQVRLYEAERVFNSYPHQISGGMKQRSMIAMATILKPDLLIADEPTTALDVTVQKSIIELLMQLREDMKLSILFISHNLNLISKLADRVVLMRKGEVVESTFKNDFFTNPKSNYGKTLLENLKELQDIKK